MLYDPVDFLVFTDQHIIGPDGHHGSVLAHPDGFLPEFFPPEPMVGLRYGDKVKRVVSKRRVLSRANLIPDVRFFL